MQVVQLIEQVGGNLTKLCFGKLLTRGCQLIQVILTLAQVVRDYVESLVRVEYVGE